MSVPVGSRVAYLAVSQEAFEVPPACAHVTGPQAGTELISDNPFKSSGDEQVAALHRIDLWLSMPDGLDEGRAGGVVAGDGRAPAPGLLPWAGLGCCADDLSGIGS